MKKRERIARYLTILLAAVLTARAGTITFNGHKETWYNLPMNRCVTRAQKMGIPAEMWIREDGVKMFGPWVIVAAHPSKTRYTRIQTSLGEGIILDYHTTNDTELIDIAVDW